VGAFLVCLCDVCEVLPNMSTAVYLSSSLLLRRNVNDNLHSPAYFRPLLNHKFVGFPYIHK